MIVAFHDSGYGCGFIRQNGGSVPDIPKLAEVTAYKSNIISSGKCGRAKHHHLNNRCWKIVGFRKMLFHFNNVRRKYRRTACDIIGGHIYLLIKRTGFLRKFSSFSNLQIMLIA